MWPTQFYPSLISKFAIYFIATATYSTLWTFFDWRTKWRVSREVRFKNNRRRIYNTWYYQWNNLHVNLIKLKKKKKRGHWATPLIEEQFLYLFLFIKIKYCKPRKSSQIHLLQNLINVIKCDKMNCSDTIPVAYQNRWFLNCRPTWNNTSK